MPETTFEKIVRKTGIKLSECKCTLCKSQCTSTPCLGTPEDMKKIIDAGYGDRVAPTIWAVGMLINVISTPIDMIAPLWDDKKQSCTFYTNGLCELHDQGLKPTEGKLSHHTAEKISKAQKSLTWNVAKEWLSISKVRLNEFLNNKLLNTTI